MADPSIVRLNVKYFRWDDTGVTEKKKPLRMEINWFGLILRIHCLIGEKNP